MTSYSLLKPSRYVGKKKDGPVIATIAHENQQVKTYMDTSNGVRGSNPNAYNKVSYLTFFYTLKKQYLEDSFHLFLIKYSNSY